MRKCDIEISVLNGDVWTAPVSLVEKHDIHLLKSPDIVEPPIRDYETQEYPESAEAEMDRRTTFKPFDYTISLGYYGPEETANARIRGFLENMFVKRPDTDIMEGKTVRLFNYWKNVKMEGYAKGWPDKTYKIEGANGWVAFDLTIRVNDPRTLTDIQ